MDDEIGCKSGLFSLVLVAMTIGICFASWYFGLWPVAYVPMPAANPMDVYENAYHRCVMRETLSDAQCHDIALKEAYPDD